MAFISHENSKKRATLQPRISKARTLDRVGEHNYEISEQNWKKYEQIYGIQFDEKFQNRSYISPIPSHLILF